MSVLLATTGRASAADAPSITDNDWVGQALVATPATAGDTITFYECPASSAPGDPSCTGLAADPLAGDDYTVQAGDVGQVIYAAEAGAPVPDSNVVGPVTEGAPSSESPPQIDGELAAGQTLIASDGSWSQPPDSYHHSWACSGPGSCSTTTSTDGGSYPLDASQVGDTITLTETASYGPTTVTDPNATTTSAVVVPGYAGDPPQISGAVTVGQALSVAQADWESGASVGDQWRRCDAAGENCVAIPGATGTSYVVQAPDAGAKLDVLETATQNGVSARAVSPSTDFVTDGSPTTTSTTTSPTPPTTTSTTTSPTAPPPATTPAPAPLAAPHAASVPAISGTPRRGATLTARPGAFSGAPSSYAYQWEDCPVRGRGRCTAVAGANRASFSLAARDIGQRIAVLVAASNAGGTGAAVASSRTAPVTTVSEVALSVLTRDPAPESATRLQVVVNADLPSPLKGTVALRDGAGALPGCRALPLWVLGGHAVVTCVTQLPAGRLTLRARFEPAAGVPAQSGTSASTTFTLRRLASQVSLGAPGHARAGTWLTYTATLSANEPELRPGGRVTFFDGRRPIPGCRDELVSRAHASCRVRYGDDLAHAISARYAGSAGFRGAASAVRRVLVAFPRANGRVRAMMYWTFRYAPAFTKILALTVDDAGRGASVTLGCRGRGCPFRIRTVRVGGRSADGSFSLTRAFAHRRLAVGTRVTVAVSRPDEIAKYYRFVVRARRSPAVLISCLAVGSVVPGRACTAG